ncbi:ABC transporter substrate-binding protein [Caenimonas soli]|uniref:ABC transporter substrate-binding protein n=1 Tax=Caenimonas soli TaxID=2735555 RepID=UPI00155326EC|nr:ABC transporter substrate-binding protein [Caenimonas soli]NPC59148.1 ABC transporter substrate-binding protein [Caenimonas soli]
MPKFKRFRASGALLVAATLLCRTGAAAVSDAGPIKIGLILPFKGAYGAAALSVMRGYEIALAEFNHSIGGRRVEIIQADDELAPAIGTQRFNKLVQSDKVDVVAGVISSSVGIALSELADKAKKPLVLSQAHADEVTGKFCSPYVARTSFSANAYQYAAGKYLAGKGLKNVVTMGPDYTAGRAFLGAFKRGFEDHGGKVVEQIYTPFQTTKDWSAALTRAKAANVQAIYAFYGGNEAVQVVKQHADFGMRKTLPLLGDQWVYDEMIWSALGDLVDGVEYTTVHYPGIDSPANRKFVEAFRRKYNEDPDVNVVFGYDNAKAILLTFQKLGGKMPENQAQFIATLRGLEYDSPRGRVRFSKSNSAQLNKLYVVKTIKGADGKFSRTLLDQFPGAPDLPGCEKSF